MGSVPPVDSMIISAHSTPVEICTEATFETGMLSSFLPNQRRLQAAHAQRTDHDPGGKHKIALSPPTGGEGLCRRLGSRRDRRYTHSNAPFPQTQM